MQRFHGLIAFGGSLFARHVQRAALLQMDFRPDAVDALLCLAEAPIAGQQFVVQEHQRLLQIRARLMSIETA